MKKNLFNLVAIVLIAGFSNNLMAQTTASATNSANCSVIAPIGITAGNALNFGDIIKGSGNVVVDVEGARTIPGDLLAGSQLGTINAATFAVTGEAAYTYAITLPTDDAVTLDDDSMAVTAFNASTLIDLAGLTGTLDASGDDTITVGATVAVDAAQPAGDYTGEFVVTVCYN